MNQPEPMIELLKTDINTNIFECKEVKRIMPRTGRIEQTYICEICGEKCFEKYSEKYHHDEERIYDLCCMCSDNDELLCSYCIDIAWELMDKDPLN